MQWTCPYCNRDQVVTSLARYVGNHAVTFGTHIDRVKAFEYTISAVRCANVACRKITFGIHLKGGITKIDRAWQLLPPSSAKPQPDFIPRPLVDDYEESCLIRDLSPKASATLARRCLQGMIRDFCGIAKDTLAKEIAELKRRLDDGRAPAGVTSETVDAIDQVRSVGNIGAHMEKDIDLIISVEPKEAQLLIELIEMLFEEWYIARERREERLRQIKATAEAKQQVKKQAKRSSDKDSLVAASEG